MRIIGKQFIAVKRNTGGVHLIKQPGKAESLVQLSHQIMAFLLRHFLSHFFYGIVGKGYHHVFPFNNGKANGDFISIMLYRFSLSSSCFNAFHVKSVLPVFHF
jgi:hypothetical protein